MTELSSSTSLSSHTPRPLWPRSLRPGGTIGICSPAGPTPRAEESFERSVQALSARGYRVVVGRYAGEEASAEGRPYLAGSDAHRLADLNAFLADPEIDLILAARGGYGAMRLLDGIDYEAARRDPKPIVGYSDITALSLALLARAGVVSFSGIMATAGSGFGESTLDPFSEASFFEAVGAREEGEGPRVLHGPEDAPAWQVHRAPAEGRTVCGPLIPGCLSLLIALVGTPYLPDLRGSILVIEDVGEELYAVDRYLTQLRLAGGLDGVAAVLVASFNGTKEQDDLLAREVPSLCLEMTPPGVVVASGVAYGHVSRRFTLPVGAPVSVDLESGSFTVL